MESYFVVTAPGFEEITSSEMRRIGLLPKPAARKGRSTPARPGGTPAEPGDDSGGVAFDGHPEHLYRANLRLRTASRVLVRLGDFDASAFPELVKKAAVLDWVRYLKPGRPVRLHVTCHKSRLYHTDAVAERVLAAIEKRMGRRSPAVKPADDNPANPAQLIVVRIADDHCTISIDSSGALLHRRGYRLETAKAPLRETLAAAMLLASGWDLSAPLLDPFCGSGTIAIEAALLAAGRAPGLYRHFAFQDWPFYEPETWDTVRAAALKAASSAPMPPILASDRDAGAVRIAQANAERAGVLGQIEFSQRAISAIEPAAAAVSAGAVPGWVVTNPPYGVRVSTGADLRSLYAQFGNVLRARCPGWKVAVLCGDPLLLGQIGIPLETVFSTINGGLPVKISAGRVDGEESER